MSNWRKLRGVKSLVHDAVSATATLVGEGNDSAARTGVRLASLVPGLAEPAARVESVRKFSTEGVLLSVKAVNRLVQAASDLVLDVTEPASLPTPPIPLRSDVQGTRTWAADTLIGAVNGVVGDHLARRGNPLDMGMSLRWGAGEPPRVRPARVALFVHGLAATEWSWALGSERLLGEAGATFGTLLERDLGHLPLYARYNTGRHLSESGRALCAALEELWRTLQSLPSAPGQPADAPTELVLVGHSAGGLVCRSATLHARQLHCTWLGSLRRVVCIGTPHQGAALERFGQAVAEALHAVDLPATRIPAALIRARSDGIRDLRHGDVREEGWRGRGEHERAPAEEVMAEDLLPGVRYAFLAGAFLPRVPDGLGDLVGDLLVQVGSAEGPRDMRVPGALTARFEGVHHNELQVHPAVYDQVRRFCAGELDG